MNVVYMKKYAEIEANRSLWCYQ